MKKIKKLNLERKAIWFFVQGDLFWTVNVNNDLPEGALAGIDLAFDLNSTSYHLGYYQHRACILIDLQHQAIELPFGRWTSLRELMADAEPEFFNMAGRAWQVANFVRTHQFCGQCGEKKIAINWEVASQCRACGHRAYPRVSPAVMMAVVKDGKVLLAQNKRNHGGIYSVLAGFVEVGETLEQTVAREVKEEVGLEVCNIRYFGSQPWPFPHNMMIAYIADYQSGEINIDPNELLAANWYDANNLPELPGQHSLARQLVNHILDC
ncbi:MAG: NAD(+) diphosphatase [Gammaproteobacteria bacterium]|nr:NAD(+) diphosphatase [Gammaproteobacteria bacterium]